MKTGQCSFRAAAAHKNDYVNNEHQVPRIILPICLNRLTAGNRQQWPINARSDEEVAAPSARRPTRLLR